MYDIVIVGGGVAGMTAAIYALRNNKKVLLIDKECCGGQVIKSPKIENFPSINEISGSDLVSNMMNQLENLNIEEIKIMTEVKKIEKDKKEIFHIFTQNSDEILAKSVIIAAGVSPNNLPIENAERFVGKGVYFCAICDGPFFENQEVALVGDGNSAMQYALLLTNYCSKVKMFTMSEYLYGEEALQTAVRNNEKIEIIPHTMVVKLNGDEKLSSLAYHIIPEKREETIETNALFVAIGQSPNNGRFSNLVDIDEKGYIISDENCHTKTSGLFVAGDCRVKKIRQVATAIGDGAIAGAEAVNYLICKE